MVRGRGEEKIRYIPGEICIIDDFLRAKKEREDNLSASDEELEDLVLHLAEAREDKYLRKANAIKIILRRRKVAFQSAQSEAATGVDISQSPSGVKNGKPVNYEKIIGTIMEACSKLKEAMGFLMERCRELEEENKRLVADRNDCYEQLRRLMKVRTAVEEYQEVFFPKPKVR